MLATTLFAAGLLSSAGRPEGKFIVDSAMTPEQAMSGTRMPRAQQFSITLVDVNYLGFDGNLHRGQIQVANDVAEEVQQIFEDLVSIRFPITRVVPVTRYGWSDSASIRDNNTSAFNYRAVIVPGQPTNRLSRHAQGRAIDLNPYLNPFVNANGRGNRPYNPTVIGTIYQGSSVIEVFRRREWTWGGDYAGGKDYQHFEKL